MGAGLRTIVLAGVIVVGGDGFVLPDVKLADVEAIRVRLAQSLGANPEPFGAVHATTPATNPAKGGRSNADTGLTIISEAPRAASPDPPKASAPKAPVQIAMLTQPDLPLADPKHEDTREAPTAIKPADGSVVPEASIDQYLFSLYQRAPKVDSIKVVEQKRVPVVEKGRVRTILKKLVNLVREDFAWKDPKAADKAGMPLMEYVIGGMDRNFKLRLYPALRAMDDAGLAPGITSAFRDDYRQSLASGLKAATDRSYHGGSSHGGYGHGLAVDLVSVKGENAADRWASTEKLWKWIDEHGKEFGIGRPYSDRDPAHVAPIDGKEYADHHRDPKAQHPGRKHLVARLVRWSSVR
jgi:hypothetical protein